MRTDTPLQALNLLNDPVFLEAARALAEQVQKDQDFSLSLTRLFERTLDREPGDAEAQRLRAYFNQERNQFGDRAAWASVASVLLNLDEFIVRE